MLWANSTKLRSSDFLTILFIPSLCNVSLEHFWILCASKDSVRILEKSFGIVLDYTGFSRFLLGLSRLLLNLIEINNDSVRKRQNDQRRECSSASFRFFQLLPVLTETKFGIPLQFFYHRKDYYLTEAASSTIVNGRCKKKKEKKKKKKKKKAWQRDGRPLLIHFPFGVLVVFIQVRWTNRNHTEVIHCP